jgi:hypothetical protein
MLTVIPSTNPAPKYRLGAYLSFLLLFGLLLRNANLFQFRRCATFEVCQRLFPEMKPLLDMAFHQ